MPLLFAGKVKSRGHRQIGCLQVCYIVPERAGCVGMGHIRHPGKMKVRALHTRTMGSVGSVCSHRVAEARVAGWASGRRVTSGSGCV